MQYKAKSTRITDGHPSDCYGRSLSILMEWAEAEAKGGWEAEIVAMQETVVAKFYPPCEWGEKFPCILSGTSHKICDYTGLDTPVTLEAAKKATAGK